MSKTFAIRAKKENTEVGKTRGYLQIGVRRGSRKWGMESEKEDERARGRRPRRKVTVPSFPIGIQQGINDVLIEFKKRRGRPSI
jgi:formylglycine-generating enzyme required for sulfatase activity